MKSERRNIRNSEKAWNDELPISQLTSLNDESSQRTEHTPKRVVSSEAAHHRPSWSIELDPMIGCDGVGATSTLNRTTLSNGEQRVVVGLKVCLCGTDLWWHALGRNRHLADGPGHPKVLQRGGPPRAPHVLPALRCRRLIVLRVATRNNVEQ